MSFKVKSQAEFDKKLSDMTSGLNNHRVLRDDMKVAKKGGIAWATLSLFCKIFFVDINKHYRPKKVVTNLSKFCVDNREFITDENRKNAVCDVMRALDRAIVDRKGRKKHHAQIKKDKREIKYLFAKDHPVAPLASGAGTPSRPRPTSGRPLPTPPSARPTPPPPPPQPSASFTPPPAQAGRASLLADIQKGKTLKGTSKPAPKPAPNPTPIPTASPSPTSSPSTNRPAPGLGGFDPAAALAGLRKTGSKANVNGSAT